MAKFVLAIFVVVAAVVGYFLVQKLELETRSISLSVEIRGPSKEDIFASLIDPYLITSLHPLADNPAVTDLQKSKNDIGNDQVTYTYHEVIPMFGIYNQKTSLPTTMTVLEPNSMVQFNVSVHSDLLKVHQYWELTDIADGSVKVTDNLAITSYGILARYAASEALKAHTMLLNNLKKKLEQ
ncbi:uncharacterized protein LOC116306062 [Actinia tenebrosa]|uniref:Uncharacterized protein LOC116306062 n=1 Tax=Actinia tenebrosa TaxID=6105 RepID=A0A6P8IXQ1_ACTTE|nr:uncharacterized protein LOC116306062 [Actinia tenebrosa]